MNLTEISFQEVISYLKGKNVSVVPKREIKNKSGIRKFFINYGNFKEELFYGDICKNDLIFFGDKKQHGLFLKELGGKEKKVKISKLELNKEYLFKIRNYAVELLVLGIVFLDLEEEEEKIEFLWLQDDSENYFFAKIIGDKANELFLLSE